MRIVARRISSAALLVAVLGLPGAARSVEGLGAHKGSFLLFPYWDNEGANRTYFRISMAAERNDLLPAGAIRLHLFYLAPNPEAGSPDRQVPACRELDRQLTLTENDWEIVNTYGHGDRFSGAEGRRGWAFAYAELARPDAGRRKVLWDRFLSDTFLVDTSLGTAMGWGNYQQWGREDAPSVQVLLDGQNPGLCDMLRDVQRDEVGAPPNDVCLLGPGDGRAALDGTEYGAAVFPDTFYAGYFTERRSMRGGTFAPTRYSVLPVHADDRPGARGAFFDIATPAGDLFYAYDVEVFDDNERSFSAPPGYVVCHGLRDVHELTSGVTRSLKQGFLVLWEVDGIFGAGESEDAVLLQIEALSGIGGQSGRDGAWAFYPAHNRTTEDVVHPPGDAVYGDAGP